MNNSFPSALSVGTNVNGYIINKVIGQGGFGITYLASDTHKKEFVLKEYCPVGLASRDVANKVISISYNLDDGKESSRRTSTTSTPSLCKYAKYFKDKAKILQGVRNEAIVKVLDIFDENDTTYILMEFVKGNTLANRVDLLMSEKQIMSDEEIMKWLDPLMDGLEFVHNLGILHNDVNPEKIIINPETGKGCLVGFFALTYDQYNVQRDANYNDILLSPSVSSGFTPIELYPRDCITPSYVRANNCPITGKQHTIYGKNLGAWTDIYALGATILFALTGYTPMDAYARNRTFECCGSDLLVEDVDRLIKNGHSEKLLSTVIKMLALLPNDRLQTIDCVRNALN